MGLIYELLVFYDLHSFSVDPWAKRGRSEGHSSPSAEGASRQAWQWYEQSYAEQTHLDDSAGSGMAAKRFLHFFHGKSSPWLCLPKNVKLES